MTTEFAFIGEVDAGLAGLLADLLDRRLPFHVLPGDVRPPEGATVVRVAPADVAALEAELAALRDAGAPPALVLCRELELHQGFRLMREYGVEVVLLAEGAEALLSAAGRRPAAPPRAPSVRPPPAPPPPAATPVTATTFSGPTPTGSRLAPRPPVPTPATFPPRPPTAGAVVIGSADDLPTLDSHTAALHGLAERDDCSVEELEQFLAKEPGLISVVLRTSNSAYYRSPKIITNLRDAIVRMGVRHTVAILLEATMQRSLQLPSAQAQRRLAAAWANARLTARLTRRLAQWGAFCRPEDAYLAGLMHNLGEWVLIWRFFRREGEQSVGAFTAEGPKIIAQHEVVGQATALKWGMPPLVQALCGAHHQPRRGELPRDRSLRLSALASWTLARALLGEYLHGYPEADVAAAIEPLGLTPNVKTALTTECALCVSDLDTDAAPLDAVVAALRG